MTKIILFSMISIFLNSKVLISYNHHDIGNFFNSVVDEWDLPIPNYISKAPNIAKLNFVENKSSYQYYFELAGFKKEDIKLTIKNNYLNIKTNKRFKHLINNKNLKQQEISSYSFSRSIELEKDVDLTRTKVSYINGILKVLIHKDLLKDKNRIQTLKIN